ncbi:ATP-dependent zinc protease [Leptospira sp. 'Mane']|uniref:ATP-dependent zinc protease family protein n=1 Tax=Leptospira sp. 'Mane' TaxID=3387407 RepID=UPI00398BB591
MRHRLLLLIWIIPFSAFGGCFRGNIKEKKPDPHTKPIVIPPQYLKPIIGRVEWVEIPNLKLRIRARIDTGAKTCSIHAVNIEKKTENGENYVYFDTFLPDGKIVRVKSKYSSETKVVSTNGQSETRIVVREVLKLGKIMEEVNLTLNDRTNLTYPFLIGRNFLMGKYLVDVSLSHALGD